MLICSQSGFNTANVSRQFQTQRQRSINSPVTPNLRQNSFPDGFTEPPSPTTQNSYGPNMFNNQQMRMARQQSIPNATQHLPGKLNAFPNLLCIFDRLLLCMKASFYFKSVSLSLTLFLSHIYSLSVSLS